MDVKISYEVVHWPLGGRIQLCQTENLARNLALLGKTGTGHIVRQVVFLNEKLIKSQKEKNGILKRNQNARRSTSL